MQVDFDSLPVLPLAEFFSSGHGMPEKAHMTRQFGEIVAGLYLGAAPGVDDIVEQSNVRLIIRMNAGNKEPPFRVGRRPFNSDGLVVGAAGVLVAGSVRKPKPAVAAATAASSSSSAAAAAAPDGGHGGSCTAVSQQTFFHMLEQQLLADVSSSESECPLRNCGKDSWKLTPVFVMSIAAVDEPGYDLSTHFHETSTAIEKVLQARRSAIANGEPKETPAEGDLSEEQRQLLAAAARPAKKFRASFGPPLGDHLWAPSVAVHCAAGVSRSATICAAYILRRTKADPRDVVSFMKSKRNVVCPNSGFLANLHRWRETEFLPVHEPQQFAKELVAKNDAAALRGILQRACYSLVVGRSPTEIDFFTMHESVVKLLLQQQQKQLEKEGEVPPTAAASSPSPSMSPLHRQESLQHVLHKSSAIVMTFDALRRALANNVDLDTPYLFTQFVLLTTNRFATHPSDFLIFSAVKQTTKKSSSSSSSKKTAVTLPAYAFSDSITQRALWRVVLDEMEQQPGEHQHLLDHEDATTAAAADNDDHDEDETKSKKRKQHRHSSGSKKSLLDRVEDARQRCTRALKLCRLNATSGMRLKAVTKITFSSAASAGDDEHGAAAEPAVFSSLRRFVMQPVVSCFRKSFSFLPFIVFSNTSFWDGVSTFIHKGVVENTTTPYSSEKVLHLVDGILRSPFSSGSNAAKATPNLLAGIMGQAPPPPPPASAQLSPALSRRTSPTKKGPDDEQQGSFEDRLSDVTLIVKSPTAQQQHPDPEVDLFVQLTMTGAMMTEQAPKKKKEEEQDDEKEEEEDPDTQRFCKVVGSWATSTVSRLLQENDDALSKVSDTDAAALLELMCLLVEKAVGAVTAISIIQSPQLKFPEHQVKLRDKDDPANMLPLRKVEDKVLAALLSWFFGDDRELLAPLPVMLLQELPPEAVGEDFLVEMGKVEARCKKDWLAFFDLSFHRDFGLLHKN